MAEEELATKSPENDAQESLIPGDTVAQEGASMGVSIVYQIGSMKPNSS